MSDPTPTPIPQPIPPTDPQFSSQRQLTIIIYALYGSAFFLGGIPAIAAIIINYVKRNEIQDPMLASHFTWQIRSFWIALGLAIVGAITTFIGVGFIILMAAAIWNIYRLVRGVLNILDNKAMPTPQ